MLEKILKLFRRKYIIAKYDSALTTADNRRHWANADNLSADAAASPDVRKTLRSRARYEVANNSYAKGIALTIAYDVVGTGPRLQLSTGQPEIDRLFEDRFSTWCRKIDLGCKLRTMRLARIQDGEAFAILSTNPKLNHEVKLDVRLIEADMVSSGADLQPGAVDGIEYDEYGNPAIYHILKAHPGDPFNATTEYDRIPADSVIHWYRIDRPGQSRGIPEITPALPLFAMLRRYSLATLAAAETAANIAVLMKTDMPAGGAAAEVSPMTELELSPNSALFVPEGWEPSQIRSEHPSTTYDQFKRSIVNEIGRCLMMSLNIAMGDSSGSNFASGRLDHKLYFRAVRIDQASCETVVLDRIITSWIDEAIKAHNVRSITIDDCRWQWYWDGYEHIDPLKEANAIDTLLRNGATTLAAEYAKIGRDWEAELRQRAREINLMHELGIADELSKEVERSNVIDEEGDE